MWITDEYVWVYDTLNISFRDEHSFPMAQKPW